MSFPNIRGPEDPEDYCFEVQLGEEQELVQIDDRHLVVVYPEGHSAFGITAKEAHDAEGATVPTTIAKTGANLVTLTVHHREGNPLAAGAPFDYPVVGGPGWEGGFHTVEVLMPTVSPPLPAGEEAPAPSCTVPRLQGRSLAAARTALHDAHCHLGPIRGERSRGARIVKQYRPAYKTLPAGTEVGIKLGR